MSRRYPSGFIRPGYNPLEVPDAPTSVSATGGDSSADVSFTSPANIGGAAITAYYAVSTPGQITGTASASPVTVSGLSNGTSYTFTVWALNSYGPSPYSVASGSVTPSLQVAFFGGGSGASETNVIDQVSISSLGNATDIGDLPVSVYYLGACASSTRAVWAGGILSGSTRVNNISYITVASSGNASDFGDLEIERALFPGSSNSTKGIFPGGSLSSGRTTICSDITIASLGNSASFGDLSQATNYLAACSSPTRCLIGGGDTGSQVNVIEYFTYSSLGNSSDFGDLTVSRSELAGCSSSTRGIFAGGVNTSYSPTNIIDYVTIASTGNATDFGDLLQLSSEGTCGGTSSATRGLFAGLFTAYANPGLNNIISYITIASTGNASDFGDMTVARYGLGATSNCHGGIA